MPDVFISKKSKIVPANPVHPGNREKLPGHKHNPFSSFCYYPHGVGFINQNPDEIVILLVRRHFLTNLGWLLIVVGMSLAPLILRHFPLLTFLPLTFQTIAIGAWYLVAMAIFIEGFLSWFYSVNIVTNKRVVDVDFFNLIYREITDAEIEVIQDVTVKIGSVVRTIFNYGDVDVETAGEKPNIEFQSVPQPDRIVRILSELRMKAR